MKLIGWIAWIMLGLLSLAAVGCAGADCEALCKEAQSRDCTSVDGDCTAFCSSLEKISAAAGCDEQKDTYHSCLNEGDVCTGEARCSSEEIALTNCGGAYCAANMSNADCQVVINSF